MGTGVLILLVANLGRGSEARLVENFYRSSCPNVQAIVKHAVSTKLSQTPITISLAGDGFDTVVKAKQAVEAQCPGVVSCAVILALAACDVVVLGSVVSQNYLSSMLDQEKEESSFRDRESIMGSLI